MHVHGSDSQVRLRITNSLDSAQTVVLEPWTTEHRLQLGEGVDLLASGDSAYPLEIELVDDRIIVCCFDSERASMSILGDE